LKEETICCKNDIYTRFCFYKQLHFWVEPGVAKSLLQFEPQSCLLDHLELIIISLLQAKVALYFCHFFLILGTLGLKLKVA